MTARPWVIALNWMNFVQRVKRMPAPMRTRNVHGPHMKPPMSPKKSMVASMSFPWVRGTRSPADQVAAAA
jgi:hypothetical protein